MCGFFSWLSGMYSIVGVWHRVVAPYGGDWGGNVYHGCVLCRIHICVMSIDGGGDGETGER